MKVIYLESSIQGKFLGDNYLGEIISGQLFCVAIVWASIDQSLIIWSGAIARKAILFLFRGDSYLGGRQFSWGTMVRGKLSYSLFEYLGLNNFKRHE